jgi:beta-glucuronidase
LLHVVVVTMPAIASVASTRFDLNGSWRFRIDRNKEGEAQGWDTTLPPGTEVVRVPHTWNLGKYDDYEGVAWYFRSLELSPAIRGQQVELHFAATFYQSHDLAYGELLGTEVTQ